MRKCPVGTVEFAANGSTCATPGLFASRLSRSSLRRQSYALEAVEICSVTNIQRRRSRQLGLESRFDCVQCGGLNIADGNSPAGSGKTGAPLPLQTPAPVTKTSLSRAAGAIRLVKASGPVFENLEYLRECLPASLQQGCPALAERTCWCDLAQSQRHERFHVALYLDVGGL